MSKIEKKSQKLRFPTYSPKHHGAHNGAEENNLQQSIAGHQLAQRTNHDFSGIEALLTNKLRAVPTRYSFLVEMNLNRSHLPKSKAVARENNEVRNARPLRRENVSA